MDSAKHANISYLPHVELFTIHQSDVFLLRRGERVSAVATNNKTEKRVIRSVSCKGIEFGKVKAKYITHYTKIHAHFQLTIHCHELPRVESQISP